MSRLPGWATRTCRPPPPPPRTCPVLKSATARFWRTASPSAGSRPPSSARRYCSMASSYRPSCAVHRPQVRPDAGGVGNGPQDLLVQRRRPLQVAGLVEHDRPVEQGRQVAVLGRAAPAGGRQHPPAQGGNEGSGRVRTGRSLGVFPRDAAPAAGGAPVRRQATRTIIRRPREPARPPPVAVGVHAKGVDRPPDRVLTSGPTVSSITRTDAARRSSDVKPAQNLHRS